MGVNKLWDRAPRPPQVGPFREGAFTSRLHDEKSAAVLGLALGVAFSVCFLTGLYSHQLQHPASWFEAFPRPVGLYRFTQGMHVATGIASIPLLFAKLWTVFPKLFAWPPFTSAAQALERIFLLPMIGGALFLLFSGINNINGRYPYGKFNFPEGHWYAAWIMIGSLIVHIGAKVDTTRTALKRGHTDAGASTNAAATPRHSRVSRRAFFGTAFGASGLITLFTVGQTLGPFSKLALLAPRRSDTGPQGFPVNRTASGAGVADIDMEQYRMRVHGVGIAPHEFTYEELLALPQHTAELPIACVEGWSSSQVWTGVSLRTLLDAVGAHHDAHVMVLSIPPRPSERNPNPRRPSYGTSELNAKLARDANTLLALKVNGETLHPDHGYPVRLIAANRPGVLQTKWLNEIEVL
jgi:DMSO/TMAO reductase YedYZ molybdopterin-dependent catalytic subunit